MNMLTSKRMLAVAAALVVVVGAGGAIAASNGASTSGNDFLARVAQHLGISTQKLQDATKAATIDQVDADLKAGRITKAQADQLKARINAGDVPFFGGPGRFHQGFGEHRGPPGEHLSAAAGYLGLTVPQLQAKLSAGTSLAAVAKAQNKSVDGLKQAMLDAAQKQLDQAVKDGMLTADQAKQEQSELKSRIDGIVNGTFPGPGMHQEFRFRGGPGAPGRSTVPAF
jgi:ribosomal protein S20